MKNTLLAWASALVGAFGLSAQGDLSNKNNVKVTLTPESAIVTSDGSAKFRLSIEVLEDVQISPTLLSGMRLQAHFGGKKRHTFTTDVQGQNIALAKGTTLERVLSADMKLVLGGGEDVAESVTFRWPGIGAPEARVLVAPDQNGIELDRLDYSKTQVRLVTNYGSITLGFRPDKAPNHVRNFVKLAKNGFYDGTRFHRVIKGFMLQGGCPNTKEGATGRPGTGDPGYKIDAEFNDLKHKRGVLSAARSASPNSAGSQFFIMHQAATHLDGQYTAYGQVEEGLDIIDKIANVKCGGPQRSTPEEPVHLYTAVVYPVYK